MPSFVHFPNGFECSVCLEHQSETGGRLIEGSPVCSDCIVTGICPLFEAALEHEFNWPPKWGATGLKARDFEHVLGEEFVERYKRKEKDYKAPPANRTYCTSKVLARHRRVPGASRSEPIALSEAEAEMYRSRGIEVVDCGACVSVRPQRAGDKLECYSCRGETICTGEVKGVAELEGQTRGVDYQVCGSCHSLCYLYDGCNLIHCPCGRDVCFMCGTTVKPHDGHFARGECPRWNRQGAPNASFDRIAPAAPAPPAPGTANAPEPPRQEATGGLELPGVVMDVGTGEIRVRPGAGPRRHPETAEETGIFEEIMAFSRGVAGRVRLDLSLQLLEVPMDLRVQRERMRDLDRGFLHGHRHAQTEIETRFITEHLHLVGLMNSVGEHRLRERPPRLRSAFLRYKAELALPERIEEAWAEERTRHRNLQA